MTKINHSNEEYCPQGHRHSDARVTGNVWKQHFPNLAYITYITTLRSLLEDCGTILDIGCGDSSPLQYVYDSKIIGVEGYEPSYKKALALRTHDKLHYLKVSDLKSSFKEGEFDACAALDIIEHLPKEQGWELIEAMERIARKKVLIATPNGFLPQMSRDGNLQEHVSGWTRDEFAHKGFTVFGMQGLKCLRTEYHALKYRPKIFWGIISEMTHYAWTRRHPDSAAALLCVKSR